MLVSVGDTYFHVLEIPFMIFLVTAVIAQISFKGSRIAIQYPSAISIVLGSIILYICAILLSAINAIDAALVMRATLKWIEVFLVVFLVFLYIRNESQFYHVYWFLFLCVFSSILFVIYKIGIGEKSLFSFRIFPSYESALALGLLLPFANLKIKSLFWLMALICVISAFLSFSRGAWLATLACLFYISKSNYRTSGKKILISLFVFILALFLIPVIRDSFSYWLSTIFQSKSASNVERLALYRIAIEAFLRHPFFGIGSLNYPRFFMREGMIEGLSAETMDRMEPHNTFLQVAAEEGSIGLLCFCLVIGSTWFLLRRIKSETRLEKPYMVGLTAFYIVMFFNLVFGYIASQFRFLIAIMIGLVLAAAKIPQDEK